MGLPTTAFFDDEDVKKGPAEKEWGDHDDEEIVPLDEDFKGFNEDFFTDEMDEDDDF